MKFKLIFILFNLIVAFSVLFIYLLPVIIIGSQYAATFWAGNWPIGLILVATLVLIDLFFIINWRLFNLLEREDWPALAHYLENLVITQGRRSPRLVRLLVNCQLALAEHRSILALEAKLADRPRLIATMALPFGLARLLAGDYKQAADFFINHRQSGPAKQRRWLNWYYGFSLLLARDYSLAADSFINCLQAADPLIIGLSVHFLTTSLAATLPLRRAELERPVASAVKDLKAQLPTRRSWDKELMRAAQEVHITVLSKTLDEAAETIYGKGEAVDEAD